MLARFSALAACGLALGLAAGPAFAACVLGKVAELPVTMQGLRPVVPVGINGTKARFLVDTGSFFDMLSPQTVARLKLPLLVAPPDIDVGGVGGLAKPSGTTVKTVVFGGATLNNVDFLVTQAPGADLDGIIGQNLLRLADEEYDFANGVMRLWTPHECQSGNLAYWDKAGVYSVIPLSIPVSGSGAAMLNSPRATATVNGAVMGVTLDTGSATSYMSLEAAARIGLKPGGPGVVAAGSFYGVGRRLAQTWIGPVASFKIGDEEIKNTKIRFGDMGRVDVDMLLGADFFLSHRVLISNSQHKAYFTYNGGPVFDLSRAPATAPAPVN